MSEKPFFAHRRYVVKLEFLGQIVVIKKGDGEKMFDHLWGLLKSGVKK
jgi:hypothetical protein